MYLISSKLKEELKYKIFKFIISYPFATTSNKELATIFGATGTAISSTHVTYNACAAGLGNSLNLQSVAGK